jgi:hypothetical protein
VEAQVSLAEKQSLSSYFVNRRGYVNLREATWGTTNETARHAALRIDQVLWAAAPDANVPLVAASGTIKPRDVEVQLEGGLLVRAGLTLGDRQRLSDYLEAAGKFIPLHNAMLLRSGRPAKEVNVALGDIVLNQDGIQAVWEVAAQDDTAALEGADAVPNLSTAEPPE